MTRHHDEVELTTPIHRDQIAYDSLEVRQIPPLLKDRYRGIETVDPRGQFYLSSLARVRHQDW